MTLLMVMAALVVPHSEPVAERKLPCVGACRTRHRWRVEIRGYRPWLRSLRWCESTDNPKAYNPAGPYYGLYQFSLSTWRSVGGHGLPSNATRLEQGYRAVKLRKRSGTGQWPVCG
jgi:hypothetical protein